MDRGEVFVGSAATGNIFDDPEFFHDEDENVEDDELVDVEELIGDDEDVEDDGEYDEDIEGGEEDEGDPDQWRQEAEVLREQLERYRQEQAGRTVQDQKAKEFQLRAMLDMQEQREWQRAQEAAGRLPFEQGSKLLSDLRAAHARRRSGFETKLVDLRTQDQERRQKIQIVSDWIDELQRRHNLSNSQKMRLYAVSDPRLMEEFAADMAGETNQRVQGRRSEKAARRRSSGVDTVVVGGRAVPSKVRKGSLDHLAVMAGDILD